MRYNIIEVEDLKCMIKDYINKDIQKQYETNIKNWFDDKYEFVDQG